MTFALRLSGISEQLGNAALIAAGVVSVVDGLGGEALPLRSHGTAVTIQPVHRPELRCHAA